jgi:cytochrome P450 family 6
MASVIFRHHNMGNKIKEIYDAMRARGHKYVGLYFFSRKAFLPLDPVLIKKILAQDFQHFHDRGIYYDEENDPISAHLFSLAGPKWKNLRARLTPAYSPNKLKYMFDTILDCGTRMVDILEEIAEIDGKVEIKEILAR